MHICVFKLSALDHRTMQFNCKIQKRKKAGEGHKACLLAFLPLLLPCFCKVILPARSSS